MATQRYERHASPLWAFILIALGAIWLLFEAKILTGANLVVLFRLWPVILIAFGLELLIGRGSRSMSLAIGLGTVILLLALMVVGPALGLAPSVEVQEQQYSEPLGAATSAQVNLDLSVGRTTIQPLTAPDTLVTADLRYVGTVDFRVDGTTQKYVTLSARDNSVQFFDFLGISLFNGVENDQLRWTIGLTTGIPLDLRLSGGVGESTVDLRDLQLTNLSYNNGVGDGTVSLPGSGSYSVDLNGGVGNTSVIFAPGAAVTVKVNAGVGNMLLDVPDNAAVRLESRSGLGNVSVPGSFNRLSGSDNNGLDHSGTWETESYASAGDNARITIDYNGGVGNLSIQ